jgi:hypothetical protein
VDRVNGKPAVLVGLGVLTNRRAAVRIILGKLGMTTRGAAAGVRRLRLSDSFPPEDAPGP